jgi:Na+/H+-dicarboxylate symporter
MSEEENINTKEQEGTHHPSLPLHYELETSKSIWARWHRTPLYLRIIGALVLGVIVGVALGMFGETGVKIANGLSIPSKLVLRLLGAIAPVLILFAIMHALMTAKIKGKTGFRLVRLLLLNTIVAIVIGLVVANMIRPGRWAKLEPPKQEQSSTSQQKDALTQFLDNVPKSLLGPLGDDGKVISVIFLAVAFGIALRRKKDESVGTVLDFVETVFETMIIVLHWIIDVIPIAVFGIVAGIIGTKGFSDFVALGAFVLAVILALLLQAAYYLIRIRFSSWVNPIDLIRKTSDALVMAFSTASSTITMPITYERLRDGVGLREQNASMGALVGSNFNNDGTALYEAMSALFIAQMLGMELGLAQQLLVVVTSVIASVGAAGIPEAGLVTMTLVFTSVGLPTPFIAILLTVDWFLDRCRTTINVMGDMNVACILDGKEKSVESSGHAKAVPVN